MEVNKINIERLVSEYKLEIDLTDYKILGWGGNGKAYKLKNGKVLKVTSSSDEAFVVEKLAGKKFKYLADIYSFNKISDNLFIYELEYLKVSWTKGENNLFNNLVYFFDKNNNLEKWKKFISLDDFEKISELNSSSEKIQIPIDLSLERINFFINGINNILDEIHENGLEADFIDMGSIDNFGIKKGSLGLFDLNKFKK